MIQLLLTGQSICLVCSVPFLFCCCSHVQRRKLEGNDKNGAVSHQFYKQINTKWVHWYSKNNNLLLVVTRSRMGWSYFGINCNGQEYTLVNHEAMFKRRAVHCSKLRSHVPQPLPSSLLFSCSRLHLVSCPPLHSCHTSSTPTLDVTTPTLLSHYGTLGLPHITVASCEYMPLTSRESSTVAIETVAS